MGKFIRCALLIVAAATSSVFADAIPIADVTRPAPVSFENDVLPILRANCLACHSATEKQGGLILESPAQILKGGDSGPAIVPGAGRESLLLKLASHADDPAMPPKDNEVAAKNLSSEELGLIKLWIDQGAKGSGAVATLSPKSWQPLPLGVHPVLAVALSPDAQFVACARANQICLYHVASGQLVTKMTDATLQQNDLPGIAHRDLVQSLTFNIDGDLLASGGFREVKLWRRPSDVQNMNVATAEKIRSLQLSPDKKWVATNGTDHSVQIRNAETGEAVRQFVGHTDEVTDIRFSSDGRHLYSSSLDQLVLIQDFATGETIGQIDVPSAVTALELVAVQPATDENPHPAAHIVTAGADNSVRVFSMKDQPLGETQLAAFDQIAEFKSHSQPVTCLSVIPGRPREVLSGSRDASIRWWRTNDGGQIRQFSHGGSVTGVAAAPDGQTIAGTCESSARLWRANGQQIAELKGDIRRNNAVARAKQQLNSANSRMSVAKRLFEDAEKDVPKKTEAEKKISEDLAKTNKDVEEKQAALETAKTAKVKAELDAVAAAATVRDVQAARDAAQSAADLAAVNVKQIQDKVNRLQQAVNAAPDNEPLKTLFAETQATVPVAQAEQQQAAAAIKEPTQKLAEATTAANKAAQEIDKVQKPYNDAFAALEKAQREQNLTSQKQALAATELKQAEEIVPLRKNAFEESEAAHKSVQTTVQQAEESAKAAEMPTRSLAFSPDGSILLTGGDFNSVHSWDAASGAAIGAYSGHTGSVTALAWLNDNEFLSSADEQSLRTWQAKPGWRLERTIGSVDDPATISHRVTAVDFSHDSKLLLVGSGVPSRQGELHLFDVADGRHVLHVTGAHDDTVYSAKFSPDALRIASAGADRYVRTFDTQSGTQLRRFEGHTDHVLGVSWKSDGQTLASSSADNTIKVWDVETGDQYRTVSNFKRHVTALDFFADGDDVICVCGDRTTRILRTSNGGTIRNFSGPMTWIHCTDISPSGNVAAAGDADGNLFVWNATSGQLLHTINDSPTENATAK